MAFVNAFAATVSALWSFGTAATSSCAWVQASSSRFSRCAILTSMIRGSIEAVAKTAVGVSTLTPLEGGSREREAARVTPAMYYLLPSWRGAVVADAGLPDDPEFRAAFVGYVEWGTRLALQNSQPDADVVTAAPVPRWGWGVAPPYQP